MLGYLFWSISFFFQRGDPLVAEIPQPNLVAKSADFSKISKKKNFFFGKISTTEVGLWAPKNAKKMQKSGVLTICGCTKHTSVYKPTPIQW